MWTRPFVRCGREFSTCDPRSVSVAVCGAKGGIGQPLSLLLKLSPLVSELALYDIGKVAGVVADLSHIDSMAAVKGFQGEDEMKAALCDKDIVIIPAGLPRTKEMTRADLLGINACVVKNIVECCAENCPEAWIGIITNPVNSLVPIAAAVMKEHGVYNPNKIFGVTALDMVRASTFVANAKGIDPSKVHVPVIGGHSGVTILPLISQSKPKVEFPDEQIVALTLRIQDAGAEVVQAKVGAGGGSATLSMAYAAARCILNFCRAIRGERDIVDYAYIASNITDAKFFTSPFRLGKHGVEKNLGLPTLSKYEEKLLKIAVHELKKEIQHGEDFINPK